VFLAKAQECLAGAESEFANGRFNNCANRCYYACFQAAVAALIRAGIQPSGVQWAHGFVQAQFIGQLLNRRKLYLASVRVREALVRNLELRQAADYRQEQVSPIQASRARQRTHDFVAVIREEA
jgi:uncharacterized protein (UPF0332 family)